MTRPLALDDLAAALTAAAGVPVELVAPDGDEPGRVVVDGDEVAATPLPARLLQKGLYAVNRRHIDRWAPERVLLHAGAVSRDGAALLLPADQEHGKSTLVGGLLDRGWAYLSDEAPGLDDHLHVVPYPKPLSIDPGSWEVLPHLRPVGPLAEDGWFDRQWQVLPDVVEAAPVPLGMVVFPRYEAGAATTLTRLTPTQAIHHAVACTFVVDDDHISAEALQLLIRAVETVPCHELVSGDLAAACDAVTATWPGRHRAGGE